MLKRGPILGLIYRLVIFLSLFLEGSRLADHLEDCVVKSGLQGTNYSN